MNVATDNELAIAELQLLQRDRDLRVEDVLVDRDERFAARFLIRGDQLVDVVGAELDLGGAGRSGRRYFGSGRGLRCWHGGVGRRGVLKLIPAGARFLGNLRLGLHGWKFRRGDAAVADEEDRDDDEKEKKKDEETAAETTALTFWWRRFDPVIH